MFAWDGTLLDSMPLWYRYFPEWDTSNGLSVDAALAEVRDKVAWEYAHTVQPFPGVRDFLDELAAAGIPMAIGSSTSVPLLETALEAHGLRGYFSAVLYTGDVGADKQHPDIYYAARDAIGGQTETTWVFEDAPFGARTAHDASFPVVALLNDHDGRDEAFMTANSDILAHGYPELSLALLQDYERPFAGEPEGELRALIVAGSPDRSSAELVRELAAEADYVIACDL